MSIHPTALVDPAARIGDGVSIGPGAIIGPHVSIGDRCEIGPRVIIEGHTTLGEECRVYPSAYLGADPQDLRYKGEPTETHIGSHNVIREFVTVHRGTPHGRGKTTIGDRNLLMANTHIAHDCQLGDHNVLSNAATLAGHTTVGSFVTIGGVTAFHQFSRVGDYAFVGGCSAVSQDVPPYFMASGNHAVAIGVNKIGLSRRGFSPEEVRSLHIAFKIIYLRGKRLREALQEIETSWPDSPKVAALVEFIRASKRGILSYGKVSG